MELYVLAAGQIDHLNRWVQDLNSQFLPIYKNGVEVPLKKRRLLVAPVQLYKIAFAKEQLDTVVAAVCPAKDYVSEKYDLGIVGKMIRSKLGLKPAPVPELINPFLQPNPFDKAVAVVPLGIKEDIMSTDGVDDGVEQI